MVDYDTSLKKVGSVGDVLEVQRTPRQSGLSSVLERLTKFVGTDIPAQEKENAASQKRESDSYNLCRQNGGSPQECESKVRSNRVGGFLGKILGRDDFQAPKTDDTGQDAYGRAAALVTDEAKATTDLKRARADNYRKSTAKAPNLEEVQNILEYLNENKGDYSEKFRNQANQVLWDILNRKSGGGNKAKKDEGIERAVKRIKDMNKYTDEEIIQGLADDFNLSEEEAKIYLEDYEV